MYSRERRGVRRSWREWSRISQSGETKALRWTGEGSDPQKWPEACVTLGETLGAPVWGR